jgi:AcrR family transcriptional regulator
MEKMKAMDTIEFPRELPDETAAVRQRILEAVDRLFYTQGIKAVSIDMISAELGISKKTVYRHFASKDDLVIAYLKGRFRPLPELSAKPPVEQILANLEWIARSLVSATDFRGCAFLNAIAELGGESSEARDLAISYKESRRLWYRELLSRLDVDDPDTLATQLSLLVDGAYAAALARNDPTAMRPAIAAARTLLKAAGVRLASDSASRRPQKSRAGRRRR